MSRRTLIGLIVPLVLIAAYFGVTSYIRAQVNDLIQHAVDQPLPAFSLLDRTGKRWSNQDLVGKRAVLHFFRSRCHSCEVEAPVIRELEKERADDVVWLHVMTDVVLDVGEDVTAATIASKDYTAPILMADAPFVELFHKAKYAQVTPVTYVIDAKGVVRFGLRGSQDAATVRQALAAVAGN